MRSPPSFCRKSREGQGALLLLVLLRRAHHGPAVPEPPSPVLPAPHRRWPGLPLTHEPRRRLALVLLRPFEVTAPHRAPSSLLTSGRSHLSEGKLRASFPPLKTGTRALILVLVSRRGMRTPSGPAGESGTSPRGSPEPTGYAGIHVSAQASLELAHSLAQAHLLTQSTH